MDSNSRVAYSDLGYVERCLLEYNDNVQMIADRRAWLEAVKAPDHLKPKYGKSNHPPTAPQEKLVMFFEGDEPLQILYRKVAPVDRWLRSNPDPDDLRFVQLRYFDRKEDGRRRKWSEVADLLGLSETHTRFALRVAVLQRISVYFT